MARKKKPVPPAADLSQSVIKAVIPAFAIAGVFFTVRWALHRSGHHKAEKML